MKQTLRPPFVKTYHEKEPNKTLLKAIRERQAEIREEARKRMLIEEPYEILGFTD